MASQLLNDVQKSECYKIISDTVKVYLGEARTYVNKNCEGKEAWQIIFITAALMVILIKLKSFLFKDENLATRSKNSFFKFVRQLPYLNKVINNKLDKSGKELQKSIRKLMKDVEYQERLPKEGLKEEKIIKLVEKYASISSVDWSKGKVSGTVYNGNEELTDLMTKVYGMTAWSNPLHPDVFPGILAMEAEVIRMICNLMNGDSETCGSMTSGGTESIFLACKAYRDYAKKVRGIDKPEMITSTSTHAAFGKAALTLGMKIIALPVDPVTMKCDIKAMKRAINKNTILLVGSTPQFPHGVIDDISAISKLGVKYDVPVHVDACLGGFLIMFMEKAGFPIEPFDFRLPGVTSISVDTHKYGYAPKGSSLILYRNKMFRHYQYYVLTEWSGGVYGTISLAGSRAGAIIAACWAALLYHGEDNYIALTKEIINTTKFLVKGLKNVKGLRILGKPEVSVIALASDYFNIYTFSEMMGKKGWNLNILQFPSSIHLCVTVLHTQNGIADQFLADVNEISSELCSRPKENVDGAAAMYGLAQAIPDRSIVSELTWYYLDALTETTN